MSTTTSVPQTVKTESCDGPKTFFDYINMFIFETLEIVILLYMVYVVQGKTVNFISILRSALIIAFIMILVEAYNTSMKNAMKMSIFASLGSKLI